MGTGVIESASTVGYSSADLSVIASGAKQSRPQRRLLRRKERSSAMTRSTSCCHEQWRRCNRHHEARSLRPAPGGTTRYNPPPQLRRLGNARDPDQPIAPSRGCTFFSFTASCTVRYARVSFLSSRSWTSSSSQNQE